MSHAKPDVGQVVERLRSMGKKPRRYRDGWLALCPAHQDTNPSLSISSNGNGSGGVTDRALLHCFAGCSYRDVLQALGLNGQHCGDMIASGRVPERGKDLNKSLRLTITAMSAATCSIR